MGGVKWTYLAHYRYRWRTVVVLCSTKDDNFFWGGGIPEQLIPNQVMWVQALGKNLQDVARNILKINSNILCYQIRPSYTVQKYINFPFKLINLLFMNFNATLLLSFKLDARCFLVHETLKWRLTTSSASLLAIVSLKTA